MGERMTHRPGRSAACGRLAELAVGGGGARPARGTDGADRHLCRAARRSVGDAGAAPFRGGPPRCVCATTWCGRRRSLIPRRTWRRSSSDGFFLVPRHGAMDEDAVTAADRARDTAAALGRGRRPQCHASLVRRRCSMPGGPELDRRAAAGEALRLGAMPVASRTTSSPPSSRPPAPLAFSRATFAV